MKNKPFCLNVMLPYIYNFIIFQQQKSKSYTLNMRSSSTNLTQKAVKGYKQNNHSDFYQLDPKIAELKKKYQLESRPQVNNNYFAHRQTSSNLRQQQVLKKLENIKSELQQIPDWQNYARSILFEGTSEANLKKTRSPIQDFTRQSNRLPSKYIPDFNFIREQNQTFQESRVLNNSNISFKINHNKSVDRPEEKPSSMNRDKGQFTPSKPDFKHNSSVNEYSKSKAYLKQNMGLKESRDGVDNKINQISRKIRQAELKKRNLGVDFIPFEDKSAYRKQDSPKHYMNENFKSKTPQYVNIKNSTSIDKLGYRPPKPPIISKFNEGAYPKQQVYQKDISPRFAQTQFNFEKQKLLIKAQNSQEIQYPISITNEKSRKNRAYSVHQNNYYRDSQYAPRNYQQRTIQVSNNLKMVQKAQEALKERKKRVENVQQKKRCKQNTKKLVQAFCEQVKLDERFRNCKLWFKAYKNDKKMNRLRSLLELEGIRISEQKLNSQFDVQQKQDNPFFSVTAQECDVQEVAKSYIECEKFWKKNLFKKFSREALEAEDFNNLSIDLDKKGYIVLEDLVRFLNMETGTFFRNRDLFTIFKRLSNNSPKVNFKDFIHNFYA